jgi:carbonic anhydrase/acetyltransferase-like protein (isoleucine patch superfamily)
MKYISEKAQVGSNVKIGYFTVIEDEVEIGDNTVIGNNVTIYRGSKIGCNTRIDDNTVIGKQPMKAVTSATSEDKLQPNCILGDGMIIGTSVIIYAGCEIGNKCLVADLSTIRENVKIGEKTIIGRGAAVENYCNIGSYCKLETNVYITAYSNIEDYVFIAPGVVTSNDNYAGRDPERYKHFKGVIVKKGELTIVGVYVIQWYDPLFWSELKANESGFLHKLAVSRKYRGKGYGRKLIQSAEELCKERGIEWLRLNCGTFRPRLRNLYESAGFKMLDRVFVDNRDQIRYLKKLV